jgi:dienelactone hydrolase
MKKNGFKYILFFLLFITVYRSNKAFAQKQGDSTAVNRSFDLSFQRPDTIFYESGQLKLKAFLLKPGGKGPFPVYIWNHGSDKDPVFNPKLAKFWVDHGFVFFAPVRSGHGGNPGPYIVDEEKKIRAGGLDPDLAFEQRVKLHEKENDDVIAACKWMMKQPFADPRRIVVAGGSYGGIQTLLTAEREAKDPIGIKCFVAMSPAAMSWNKNWAERLTRCIQTAKTPIFLMQAENDYNLGPSEVLGPLTDAKGFPSRHKLFSPHLVAGRDPDDHRQGHGGFFGDPSAWQQELLEYLEDCDAYKIEK